MKTEGCDSVLNLQLKRAITGGPFRPICLTSRLQIQDRGHAKGVCAAAAGTNDGYSLSSELGIEGPQENADPVLLAREQSPLTK